MAKDQEKREAPGGAPRGAPRGQHKGKGGRFSATRKRETVIRLLQGEPLDMLARELGVSAGTLSEWRDRFLLGAEEALKTRPRDDRDAEMQQLKAKLGDVILDNELLQAKIDRMERGLPLARRRSR